MKARTGKISPPMFWGLVFAIWFASQTPYIHVPFKFLGTWVHELGHGIGAIITGGTFHHMIVSPDFSGVAFTSVTGPWERVTVVLLGLLSPALFGSFLLILARRFGKSRAAILILALGLMLSGTIWAGDMFTRISVVGIGVLFGLLALKGNSNVNLIAAQVIAITFCLNAVTHIDYFFMRGGRASGRPMASDTEVLAEIIGLPHFLWGVMLTLLSMAILYGAAKFSGALTPLERRD